MSRVGGATELHMVFLSVVECDLMNPIKKGYEKDQELTELTEKLKAK